MATPLVPDRETTTCTTTAAPAARSRLRRLTRVAGILYLAIFVLYPLSAAVRSTLVVPGDAAGTARNIAASESLFRWGMVGEATVVLVEIALAGVLYALMRPVSRSVSLAAALARAGEGVVMAAGNLLTSIMTLVLVGGAGYLTALSTEQRDALALAFQEADSSLVLVWGLLFGLHLVLLGWLVYQSGYLPRLVGGLLALAGFGYLAQSLGTLVAPELAGVLSTVVLVLAVPGELAFSGWLLVRGVDADAWQRRALAARECEL
ncbi:DUF4386 domain-containing protein [Pseudonocardia hydrocarbonoxydans]|nr:DUF4386 domain-containing protein [Pseudonocardia hydrocarbonoxydans]